MLTLLSQATSLPPLQQMTLLEISAGGIFIIMVLKGVKELVDSLRSGSSSSSSMPNLLAGVRSETVFAMARQIDDLHNWHSVTRNGDRVWYTTRLEELIEQLLAILETQHIAHVKALNDLTATLREPHTAIAQNHGGRQNG